MMDRSHYHPPVKRSVTIAGHQSSISLEPLFWHHLRRVSDARGEPMSAVIAHIDAERLEADRPPGLAGAIRLWLLADLSQSEAADGNHTDSDAKPHASARDSR